MRGKEGITICVENVLDENPLPLAALAGAVDHPDFGICLDLGHANCYSPIPVRKWLQTLGGHIRHVHLHDNDGSADTHAPLGTGNVDLAALREELFSTTLPLSATIECTYPEDLGCSWLTATGGTGDGSAEGTDLFRRCPSAALSRSRCPSPAR